MFRSRRDFLKSTSCGFGYLAAATMAAEAAKAYENPLAPKKPHFAPKVKRVIYMFMQGAPSQHDTFDYNEELERGAGKKTESSRGNLLPSVFKFEKQGQSGLPISSVFPHVSKHADDLCLLNAMHTDSPAHPQASIFLHTGSFTFVRPALGSWTVYGLGTENSDLPGFVTLNPPNVGGAALYGSAFLPATYQGTRITIAPNQPPIANIRNTRMTTEEQRKQIDLIQQMNRGMLDKVQTDNELEGLIESYELAFRMQAAVPKVLGLAQEPDAAKEAYGLNVEATRDFGTQCLAARRMAEAGVRFIEISTGGWDHHNGLKTRMTANATAIDKPIGALITDLKQRGLWNDTLLVWGGEFGRSSWEQGPGGDGRQHNNRGFTVWLSGGAVKGGMRYGRCDVDGVAVENKTHVHDLNATILHLLGMDHTRLTYRYAGRDFRLTDVHGDVIRQVLA
ncbi:MAG: DUF1501 domain-containing protein [Acidobacteria bacterium]|nr:DUF1501 domain-containing protein [Acidobacteriota bacterium]